MSGWSWFTGTLTYKDKCTQCSQMLRQGDVVLWTDGYKYHVGCLLDLISSYHQYQVHQIQAVVAAGFPGAGTPLPRSPWGMFGGAPAPTSIPLPPGPIQVYPSPWVPDPDPTQGGTP